LSRRLCRKNSISPCWSRTSGAGGAIAGEQVVTSDKDGYTATMISAGHTVPAAMVKAVKYDAVKDFSPVALVADSAFVVVARKDFPANDRKGLIALAKAQPGKLNIASVGLGSTQHMAGEVITQATGIDVKHIPFRGTPGVIGALLGKEVDYAVESLHSVRGQVEAGDSSCSPCAGRSAGRPFPTCPPSPNPASRDMP
jgi:tripartite-type tricarboxylate transporter receptor subunit TctC